MDPVVTSLGAIGGAAVTGAVAWAIAKRGKSGQIKTTEAETLWAQAQEMRDELRTRLEHCETELTEVKREAAAAKEEALDLKTQLVDARSKMADQQMEIADLKSQLADASHELRKALTELITKNESTRTDVGVLKQELSLIKDG